MRYFANPTTQVVRDAMTAGVFGAIITPKQGNRVPPKARWCADNGCYGKGFPGEDAWLKWLGRLPYDRKLCEFAVAPDVVGDARATLARSRPWMDKVRALDLPVAFVAQNGLERLRVPWKDFDVLFIGGSTDWKLGEHARELIGRAVRHGKGVHFGRVNSRMRLRYAKQVGCTSADGTYVCFGPTKNLGRMSRWLAEVNAEEAS